MYSPHSPFSLQALADDYTDEQVWWICLSKVAYLFGIAFCPTTECTIQQYTILLLHPYCWAWVGAFSKVAA
jgi:hypothetical protein